MSKQYTHWKLKVDQHQVLWLMLDRAEASVNSLSRDVFHELDAVLDQVKSANYTGLVIGSAKKKGFIAGADVTQFESLTTPDDAFALIRDAQLVLDKLEALTIPTVAMIDGFCLGGGYELALACHYRVAADTADTKIGLPEVLLGIHPGWGGTVRLPKLIGAPNAMRIMLAGRAESARVAFKLGMIDAAVPPRELERAALWFINKQPKKQQPNWLGKCSNFFAFRPILARVFNYQLRAKHVNEKYYPAPYAIVQLWQRGGTHDQAQINEARSIAKLMVEPTARNLLRVFFLQERLKSMGKKGSFKAKHVHVIGAGVMGGDIAAWCALRGLHVTLQDQSPERVAPAIKRAHQLFKHKLKESRLVTAAMDRLQVDVDGRGVGRADVVIEAVFEDLQVKQQLFKDLESKMKKGAILASNTSSIPLEEIATVLQDPTCLVGIHFFNPVAKMPLVEVVHGSHTADAVVEQVCGFVGQLGKLPLPVASKPGFLVNRVLMPYLMEAMRLMEEGLTPKEIDKAALKFGMPMGPVTLADKVGLDVCLSVAKNLTQHFAGTVPQKLQALVDAGNLGEKTGRGFYTYHNGKKVPESESENSMTSVDVTDRLVLIMLNEAAACFAESIVSDSDLLDAGMIFGTGFAPFRGGPLQYAKARGIEDVVTTLKRLSDQYGERFTPHEGWRLLERESGASSANGMAASDLKRAAKESGSSVVSH